MIRILNEFELDGGHKNWRGMLLGSALLSALITGIVCVSPAADNYRVFNKPQLTRH